MLLLLLDYLSMALLVVSHNAVINRGHFQAAEIEGTAINGDAAAKKKNNKKKNKKANAAVENGEAEKKAENGVAEKKAENGVAENDSEAKAEENVDAGEKSQKKRNRPKKKKTEESKPSGGVKVQTDPPSIPISELFTGTYPVGQEMEYPVLQDDQTAKDRFTSEEKRALDRAQLDMYNEIRQVSYSLVATPPSLRFLVIS